MPMTIRHPARLFIMLMLMFIGAQLPAQTQSPQNSSVGAADVGTATGSNDPAESILRDGDATPPTLVPPAPDAPARRPRSWFIRTLTPEEAAREAVKIQQRQEEIGRREAAQSERQDQLAQTETQLAAQREAHASYGLRALLNGIDRNSTEARKEITRAQSQLTSLRKDRARLRQRFTSMQGEHPANAEALTEADETIQNLSESLTLLALQVRKLEFVVALGAEADRIESSVANAPVDPRPTVRLLFDKRGDRQREAHREQALAATLGATKQLQSEIAPALTLLESKNKEVGDRIQLLEEKYDLTRDRAIRDEISLEKTRLRLQQKRVETLGEQSGTLAESLNIQNHLADLYAAELATLDQDFEALLQGYWNRIQLPAWVIAGILVFGAIIAHLILPRFCQRERLFVARRLVRYLALMAILIVVLAFFFEDLRPFATTLGIAGAALVIALQDLFSSFAGWFAIISSGKVRVGDRIEVDGRRGDVLDIQLLRTTLLELRNWLDVDEPTGRVIVIPNSFIFKDKVTNFTHVHPYLWEKIDITVTYETPMRDAEAMLRRMLEEETRAEFQAARQGAGKMEEVYGVPDATYEPKVFTVIADSGVLFRLLYVSHYRHLAATRTKINARILVECEKDPRIQLAYPTFREIKA